MTRTLHLDAATMLRVERHETLSHALSGREVRDLGDALVLYDPHDPDPFWNRMARVRWPAEPDAFDRRVAETLTLFSLLDRRPHVWPSPAHGEPPDLARRLLAHGFREIGRGHLMALDDPAACPPVWPRDVPLGVDLRTIASAADVTGGELEDAALVLAEAFEALPGRSAELADELRRTLDDPRVTVVLASVDGQPAAVAKATTFDGCTYLSSIGTRSRFRDRGLGALVTRRAVEAGSGEGTELVYLGVFSDNEPALRLYRRLGFASIGESPDLLLS